MMARFFGAPTYSTVLAWFNLAAPPSADEAGRAICIVLAAGRPRARSVLLRFLLRSARHLLDGEQCAGMIASVQPSRGAQFSFDQPPAEWSGWNVSLRLAVAPAWAGGVSTRLHSARIRTKGKSATTAKITPATKENVFSSIAIIPGFHASTPGGSRTLSE